MTEQSQKRTESIGQNKSKVDVLLSNPQQRAKAEKLKEFADSRVTNEDMHWSRGIKSNTVRNKDVPGYPPVIDQRGLVVQVFSREKRFNSGPIPDEGTMSQSEIAGTVLQFLEYGTTIKAFLADLEGASDEVVVMDTVPTGRNRLDNVVNAMNQFERGGDVVMFGSKGDGNISLQEGITEYATAVGGKTGPEAAEAALAASESLRQRGAYVMVVNLSRPDGLSEPGRVVLAGSPTEPLADALLRNPV